MKCSGERREEKRKTLLENLHAPGIFLLASGDVVSKVRPRSPSVADIVWCPLRRPLSPLRAPVPAIVGGSVLVQTLLP